MTTDERYTYEAIWDEDGHYYQIRHGEGHQFWMSDDGDIWVTLDGLPIRDPAFEDCDIRLMGGPRDGEVVS